MVERHLAVHPDESAAVLVAVPAKEFRAYVTA